MHFSKNDKNNKSFFKDYRLQSEFFMTVLKKSQHFGEMGLIWNFNHQALILLSPSSVKMSFS